MTGQTERNSNMVPSLQVKSNAGNNNDVILWGDPATHALLVTGTFSVSGLSGSLSNNNAAPAANNLGALVAVANAAAPSYTEGYQVLLSTDLAGALRVTGSLSIGGTTDNSAYTAGSSSGTPAFGFYHSTIDAVTDGRSAAVAITAKRAMMVNLQTAAGAETGIAALPLQVSLANTGANATAVKVDGSAVTQPVSSTAATTHVDIGLVNAVTPLMGNGVTGTGSLRVTIASDNTAFAVNATLSAETTKVIGTVNISAAQTIATVTTVATVTNLAQMNGAALLMGNGVTGTGSQRITLASDNSALPAWGQGATGAAVPAGSQYIGGLAATANPTAATAGNLTGILMDKLGKQIVVGSIRDLKVNQVTTITTSTSETTVLTAVASTFLDVYGVIVTNTSATAVTVAFKDSTAGTTQFNIAVPAGETRGFMLPEGGAMKQGTVNNNWTATTQSVTSVIITMLAVKNI